VVGCSQGTRSRDQREKHMSREAMKQPEALRLADALDNEFTQGRISNHNGRKAAVELRRLHEVNQDLLKALHEALETDLARVGEVGVWGEWQGLTNDEVSEIIDREIGFNGCWGPEEAFARAVEQALKEKNHG
jgi:hypothetical protein